MTGQQPDRILRMKTVLVRTGLSKSTLYRRIAEGTFPSQIKIGEQSTGWYESEVNRWVANPSGYRAPSRPVTPAY
ncbi:MAG: AlpA family transcriptional regulator [Alphaproteobacteria bacterium]|jgi:prophage regulatory protein|nr:AlpA family transcriptional regulator [Alphaproteobacteria bacterium]MBU0865982.1 AlpA family transcriptional regulator [Alphaproteobacteria bacterium]MBU1824814.1 AlpA family transcriptional regulator [Alphaproteobacteria bacterium]